LLHVRENYEHVVPSGTGSLENLAHQEKCAEEVRACEGRRQFLTSTLPRKIKLQSLLLVE